MTYYKQLHPWCIIRVATNQYPVDRQQCDRHKTGANYHSEATPQEYCSSIGDDSRVVARFRKHNDAAAYLQVLQNSTTDANFSIIFDLQGVGEKVKS